MKRKKENALYLQLRVKDTVQLKHEPNVVYIVEDLVWDIVNGGYIKLNKKSPLHSLSKDNFVALSVVTYHNNKQI
jgi:hypothetical protein